MGRIDTFDYMRVIAVFGILMCHYCFNWDVTFGLGRFFGCTFNALFIGMSGLLLGYQYEKKERNSYNISFLKKRFFRLSYVYYPFLVFMFLFVVFVNCDAIRIKDVVMHIAYLPWFDKMKGFEHLWFMTMISICYVSVYLISKLKQRFGLWVIVCSLALSCIGAYFMEVNGLPGQLLIYLVVFLGCHHNASDIIKWTKDMNVVVSSACVVLLCGAAYLFYNDLYEKHRLYGEILGVLSAVLVFVLTSILLKDVKPNKIISFVASISFEIYLVHHVFAFGDHSIAITVGNPYVGFVTFIVVSVSLAYGLHRIGRLIN